ncbi:MAG: FHIPEP family type III secretion protein, partial [Deltaproteobacteria bacterium]|nr:FHIPEP family type III secretion protein [Deltaproteobacteria bacterium]
MTALGRVDPWLRGAALALLLAALLAPLPAALLDPLLVANLAASLVVLLSAADPRPTRLVSALPAVLLGGVLARLALELAASRAILGGASPGAVIAAFGAVAVRGDA